MQNTTIEQIEREAKEKGWPNVDAEIDYQGEILNMSTDLEEVGITIYFGDETYGEPASAVAIGDDQGHEFRIHPDLLAELPTPEQAAAMFDF